MSNGTHRSADAPQRIRRLAWGVAVLLAAWPSGRLSAQVGHDPARSPFRDVTTRQGVEVLGGWFVGNNTEAGVGARAGALLGARFQTRLSGPLDLSVTVVRIASTRFVVDPDSAPAARRTGPIDYGLIASDLALKLNLTGAKTWRGLGPYLSLGAGVIVPTRGRVDQGGYEARQNFTFVPTVGTTLALSRSLHASLELRNYFIRYEWPLRYLYPTNTSITPVLDPGRYDERDVTSNLSLSFGLSYRFNF